MILEQTARTGVGGRLRAELLPDRGAAAQESSFFRSAEFLGAEDVTHTLVVDGGRVRLPLVRRPIPGGGYDAVSPYGYPGGSTDGEPVHVDDVDFSATGLVSLFVRERLGEPALHGGTARSEVLVHDPARPRDVQKRLATKARSNLRAGYRPEVVPGADVDDNLLQAFADCYRETMDRVDAADRYYFDLPYLRAALDHARSSLVVVYGPDGDVAAASIAVASDAHLHYFLGATADAHRGPSPAKNVMLRMMDLADELGIPLNLGGGVRPDDHLHRFKTSFTNTSTTFRTHEIVCDPREYERLSHQVRGAGAEPSTFFPAYREPVATPAL